MSELSVSFSDFKNALLNGQVDYSIENVRISHGYQYQEAGEFTSERSYYQTTVQGDLIASCKELGVSVRSQFHTYAVGDTVEDSFKLKKPETDYDKGFIFSNKAFIGRSGEQIEPIRFDYDMRVISKNQRPGMDYVEKMLTPYVKDSINQDYATALLHQSVEQLKDEKPGLGKLCDLVNAKRDSSGKSSGVESAMQINSFKKELAAQICRLGIAGTLQLHNNTQQKPARARGL